MPDPLSVAVLLLTVAVLALLLPFASHRTFLLWLSRTPSPPTPDAWNGPLPRVTLQLPVYNERTVVERLIDAACKVDYPLDLLDIQVLDDSTDQTTILASARIRHWQHRGLNIVHLRRSNREGFKAGALSLGTGHARGDYLVILDADFVAPSGLIHDLLPPFLDPGVGMVQARWGHLNEEHNALTRAQALLLDGHFAFEQGGRFAGGRFFNFNGTAGMWRRECIDDAGGWTAETLTEDLDLSYRAQMAGWRFAYLDRVMVPGELPASVGALEVQQRRWAQGGIQVAKKILPGLVRGPWPLRVKAEACVHLCGHLAQPLTLALGLLLFPSAVARRSLGLEDFLFLDLVALALATLPFVVFYGAAARRSGRRWCGLPGRILGVLSLGIGLSAPVSGAVVRGIRGERDPFERTPKRGTAERETALRSGYGNASRSHRRFEMTMAGMMVGYLGAALIGAYWSSMPFILLFASGYTRLALGHEVTEVASNPTVAASSVAEAASSGAIEPEGAPFPDQETPNRQPDQRSDPGRLRPVAGLVVGG